MLFYFNFFIQLFLQDVWGQMRETRQPLPTSGLALAELEAGLHGQELEGPVVARPKGVSTSQGWDRHKNKMAELRKQRQTVRKVLQTSDRKFTVSVSVSAKISVSVSVPVRISVSIHISVSVSISVLVSFQAKPKFRYFGFCLNSGIGRSLLLTNKNKKTLLQKKISASAFF